MGRGTHAVWGCLLLLALVGCRHADPAPKELDDLLHFFLAQYDLGDTELLLEGGTNAIAWFDAEAGHADSEGSISDLSQEEFLALGMPDDTSAEWLNGGYHLTLQQCTLSEIQAIYLEPDQSSLFPDNYISYSRNFGLGQDCFADGACNEIQWVSSIEDSLLGKTMTYDLNSGLIWQESETAETSQMLLSRTVMPEPATIGSGDGSAFFDQSYQIEVFVPLEGLALHLYGLWNSGGLEGIDPEAPLWTNQYIGGLRDWDQRLDEICDQGLVPQ